MAVDIMLEFKNVSKSKSSVALPVGVCPLSPQNNILIFFILIIGYLDHNN